VNALASAKWTDIRERPLVLIPVGSIEQHGPHLPLETDAVIAEAVAKRVAQCLDEAVYVAPVISYTASGEHQMFSGTCSIGVEALRILIVELVRSVRSWSGRVVLVNGHGGNMSALADAVTQLVGEGHDVGWVACATEQVDAHAGFTETSLMMHLQPWAIRVNEIEVGNTEPLSRLLPVLIRAGVGAVSPNGVLGDPRAATAAEGARCLEAMASEVAAVIRDGHPDGRGVLRSAAISAS
jgi:mycofactocin system creatininase family protein